MPDYVLCPNCKSPAIQGEPCGVCEKLRAAEEAHAAEAASNPVEEQPVEPSLQEQAFVSAEGGVNAAPFAPPPPMQYGSLFEEEAVVPDSAAYRRLMEKTFVPMGAWSVFGTWLLFLIPVIGFIFAVVFACGGCRKRQKTSFARAYLLLVLFSFLFSLICVSVLFLLVMSGAISLPFPFFLPVIL